MARDEYRLYVFSSDPLFSSLPSTVRLHGDPSVAPGEWQALPEKLPEGHLFSKVAVWKRDPDGSITLDWNNDHSGIQVVVRPVPSEPGNWSGSAMTYWDVDLGAAPVPWPARLERVGV